LIYRLDTNVCIRFLNGSSPAIEGRLKAISSSQIAICSVVKAELFYGAAKSRKMEASLSRMMIFLAPFDSPSFDDEAAREYGTIRADLERIGQPIGPNDLMIAAIALSRSAILVTANTREFARVPRLKLEDWLESQPLPPTPL
jgi:tRNA(fMet)-specific endonuclease VapC